VPDNQDRSSEVQYFRTDGWTDRTFAHFFLKVSDAALVHTLGRKTMLTGLKA
jgi:hypothetical protein